MSDPLIDDIENQRPQHHVYDCATGETTITPYTNVEWEEQKAAKAAFEAAEQSRLEAEAKIEADRESGNQKLKDLGLTDDEIAAITS